MGSNSINIGWNKYETAILIDAYVQVKEGKLLRKDAVAQVSKRLRERMLKIGTTISETYRNENGISLQMSAIGYAMGNEANGINHVSNIFREIVKMYNEENDKFHQLLTIANAMYPKALDVAHIVKPTQKVDYFPKTPTLSKITKILIIRVLRFNPFSPPKSTPLLTSFFIVGFAQSGMLSSI